MSEAEVLYSDVKFTKKKGDTTEAASSSLDTTYSEVKILGTQPSNELPASQQVVSNGGSKVKSQKVALLIFCIILAVVVIVLCYVLHDYMQTKKRHEKLTVKYEALKKNFTETLSKKAKTCPICPPPPEIKPNDSCPKCDEDWKEFRGKCYYFSNKTSSWEQSRRYCRSRGGDLVKIDSEEEQRFLTKEVSDKMNYKADQFWIGLTDSKEEGKWFWVDSSPLNTSLSFWAKDQPDDWKGKKGENPEGQDCVRMGEKGETENLKCWFDGACNSPQESICEKQALNWS